MKALQDRQQGLRTRLRNNQREIHRLMNDYENFGATVVTGDQVPGMKAVGEVSLLQPNRCNYFFPQK